jgi:hypothetical protein
VTTDFRTVLSELVSGHLGQTNLARVFPGYQRGEPLGLLRGRRIALWKMPLRGYAEGPTSRS